MDKASQKIVLEWETNSTCMDFVFVLKNSVKHEKYYK